MKWQAKTDHRLTEIMDSLKNLQVYIQDIMGFI